MGNRFVESITYIPLIEPIEYHLACASATAKIETASDIVPPDNALYPKNPLGLFWENCARAGVSEQGPRSK